MSVFAPDMERLQIPEKTLITEAKRCIRTAVIKTGGQTIADSLAAANADAVSEAEQPEQGIQSRTARPMRMRRVPVSQAPS